MRTGAKSSVVGSFFVDCRESFSFRLSIALLLFSRFQSSEHCKVETEGPPEMPSPLGRIFRWTERSRCCSETSHYPRASSYTPNHLAPSTPLKRARSRLQRHAHRRRLRHTSSSPPPPSSVKHKQLGSNAHINASESVRSAAEGDSM